MITVHLNCEPETNMFPLKSAFVSVFYHKNSKSNQYPYYCFLRHAFKILSGYFTHGSLLVLLTNQHTNQAFKSEAALPLPVAGRVCSSLWRSVFLPTAHGQSHQHLLSKTLHALSSCCSSGQLLVFSMPHGCDIFRPLLFEEMSPCF